MFDTIFTYKAWDPLETLVAGHQECEFLADFGAIKAGTKAAFVDIDYDRGMLEVYLTKEDADPNYTVNFRVVAEE